MSKYLFILGKDPEISLAELYAVYPKAHFLETSDQFALLETDEKIEQYDFDRLGGVIKMGILTEECKENQLIEALAKRLVESKESGKIQFALSVYHWSEKKHLRRILSILKDRLRHLGRGSRFANQDYKNLNAAQYKNLKGRGYEWLAVRSGSKFYIARVTCVQNIDAYSYRDFYKPRRNMLVGMLPPKLAQIILNLSQAKIGDKVWDPFCGGGVVLMEGVLKHWTMWGSDIEKDRLRDAQQNLAWLQNKYGVDCQVRLFHHDAGEPLKGRLPDAIACEGYLGPPQREHFKMKRQQNLIRILNTLYTRLFTALREVEFRGPVVIAFPFFVNKQGEHVHLDRVFEAIDRMGFVAQPFLPKSKKTHLSYIRKHQWVGRRIMRFRYLG